MTINAASFERLFKDNVLIRKPDGRMIGPFRANVDDNKSIRIMDKVGGVDLTLVDVDAGDRIERPIIGSKVELYSVLDTQFSEGMPPKLPASWTLVVEKEDSLIPKESGAVTNNINIENAHSIQIGDHNIQHITTVLNGLVEAIESSEGTEEEKQEAKGLLTGFLKHPLVASALGSSAGQVVRAVLGG